MQSMEDVTPANADVDVEVEVEVEVDEHGGDCDLSVPTVGMVFNSEEDVKSFYKSYSNKQGFSWKVRNSRRGLDGKPNYLILACSREGSRSSKIPPTLRTLPTVQKNCDAKVTTSKGEDGLWCIKTVVLHHNHDLSPSKSRFFSMNKSLSLHAKRCIELGDRSGVRISKSFKTLVHESGGYENLSFGERDVRNYIHRERRAIGKEGDAKALLEYFSKMKAHDREFWYEMDLDDEFHVRNIFWADARSRAAYESFGDVVSFDTTYLTNKYAMPFAAFVGVNHHGQSVLLGCGLLSAEDTESFVWLFDSWVRCMSGKHPSGIVTDQCRAMQNAIQIVMPNTRHRWCLWHIMKKIPEKLKGYVEYGKIKTCMKEAVHESMTRDEFELRWEKFVKEHDLEENEWLVGLYNDRHKWVPIYLKGDFWAGLSTTQRSESIHHFFYGYVNSTTCLEQFVKQYENALKSRVEKEVEADFQSMNTTINCGSNSPIEKQFQEEYTHTKFGEIQAEFRCKMNCVPSLKSVDGAVATFEVIEEGMHFGHPKEMTFEVVFNRANHDVWCQCFLFEFRGIMCRHSLCVFAFERLKQVPTKYILQRWSKKIRRRHSYIKCGSDTAEVRPNMQRFDKLLKHFYEVAEVAADSDAGSNLVHSTLENLRGKLQTVDQSLAGVNMPLNGEVDSAHLSGGNGDEALEILNPVCIPRKGRPTFKRKISQVEKVQQKYKKKNTKEVQSLKIQVCTRYKFIAHGVQVVTHGLQVF